MIKTKNFYGWKLTGILWLLYFIFMGLPLYAGSIVNSYMLKEIMMDRSTYGMGFSLSVLCTGGLGIVVAFAVAKWEVRKTFLMGGVILMLGLLFMIFYASQPWHFLLGFGIIMGTGMAFTSMIPTTTTIVRWFSKYRGRAMAIVLTASSVAGFVGAPMANALLTANGGNWRIAWVFILALIAVAMLGVYFLVIERPEDVEQTPDGLPIVKESTCASKTHDVRQSTYEWNISEIFRTRAFWLILLGVIACKVPFYFFTGHGVLHVKGIGFSAAQAAVVMSFYTIGGVPGRLIGGWLMDKFAARYVFIMGICFYVIGYLLEMYIDANSIITGYIAALCIGVGFGWTFVVANTLPSYYFGRNAFAKVNGTFLTFAATLSAPIGFIGGMFHDMYGNYNMAFWFCIATALVGIFALLFAKIPLPPQKEISKFSTSHELLQKQ